jgi:UDP-glucose 4-epimerase
MKKILITGVSGFIGSCLFFFLENKFKILGLDKKKTKIIPHKQCNLLNIKKLNFLLKKEKPDLVIHLAAQSLVDETINKNRYYLNNILATKNLVLSMKKNNIKNIIFSSTAALYKFNNKILNEKSAIDPKSTYAKTKFECEKIIKKSKSKFCNFKIF